jgi:hypothetical protein
MGFFGSWTDSCQQDTSSEPMDLPVFSDQRRGCYVNHTHERRTCCQDEDQVTRSDDVRHSATSEITQTDRPQRGRERLKSYAQPKSSSMINRQQTRSGSPRPRTYGARANGRLRRGERQQNGSQEHRVRRACVKHHDDAVCRCNSNSHITRASES